MTIAISRKSSSRIESQGSYVSKRHGPHPLTLTQLFENKCDHATYFGMDPRFIQGIHMIPVSPISPYIRSASFVLKEWQQYFAATTKDRVVALLKESEGDRTGDDGWKGILWSNWAIVDPTEAWAFFSRPEFPKKWLDGGATRTWYLTLAAGTRRSEDPYVALTRHKGWTNCGAT
jgi:endoglucanase Acf2